MSSSTSVSAVGDVASASRGKSERHRKEQSSASSSPKSAPEYVASRGHARHTKASVAVATRGARNDGSLSSNSSSTNKRGLGHGGLLDSSSVVSSMSGSRWRESPPPPLLKHVVDPLSVEATHKVPEKRRKHGRDGASPRDAQSRRAMAAASVVVGTTMPPAGGNLSGDSSTQYAEANQAALEPSPSAQATLTFLIEQSSTGERGRPGSVEPIRSYAEGSMDQAPYQPPEGMFGREPMTAPPLPVEIPSMDLMSRPAEEYNENELAEIAYLLSMEGLVGAVRLKDGLFVGDQLAAMDQDFFRANGVLHVINCAGTEVPNHFQGHDIAGQPIRYLTFPWKDADGEVIFSPRGSTLRKICDFVDAADAQGASCLVHSSLGKSRSVCTVCGYFMSKYKWSARKALEFLIARRSDLTLRRTFIRQILLVERQLIQERGYKLSTAWDENFSDHIEEELLLHNTYKNSLAPREQESTDGSPDIGFGSTPCAGDGGGISDPGGLFPDASLAASEPPVSGCSDSLPISRVQWDRQDTVFDDHPFYKALAIRRLHFDLDSDGVVDAEDLDVCDDPFSSDHDDGPLFSSPTPLLPPVHLPPICPQASILKTSRNQLASSVQVSPEAASVSVSTHSSPQPVDLPSPATSTTADSGTPATPDRVNAAADPAPTQYPTMVKGRSCRSVLHERSVRAPGQPTELARSGASKALSASQTVSLAANSSHQQLPANQRRKSWDRQPSDEVALSRSPPSRPGNNQYKRSTVANRSQMTPQQSPATDEPAQRTDFVAAPVAAAATQRLFQSADSSGRDSMDAETVELGGNCALSSAPLVAVSYKPLCLRSSNKTSVVPPAEGPPPRASSPPANSSPFSSHVEYLPPRDTPSPATGSVPGTAQRPPTSTRSAAAKGLPSDAATVLGLNCRVDFASDVESGAYFGTDRQAGGKPLRAASCPRVISRTSPTENTHTDVLPSAPSSGGLIIGPASGIPLFLTQPTMDSKGAFSVADGRHRERIRSPSTDTSNAEIKTSNTQQATAGSIRGPIISNDGLNHDDPPRADPGSRSVYDTISQGQQMQLFMQPLQVDATLTGGQFRRTVGDPVIPAGSPSLSQPPHQAPLHPRPIGHIPRVFPLSETHVQPAARVSIPPTRRAILTPIIQMPTAQRLVPEATHSPTQSKIPANSSYLPVSRCSKPKSVSASELAQSIPSAIQELVPNNLASSMSIVRVGRHSVPEGVMPSTHTVRPCREKAASATAEVSQSLHRHPQLVPQTSTHQSTPVFGNQGVADSRRLAQGPVAALSPAASYNVLISLDAVHALRTQPPTRPAIQSWRSSRTTTPDITLEPRSAPSMMAVNPKATHLPSRQTPVPASCHQPRSSPLAAMAASQAMPKITRSAGASLLATQAYLAGCLPSSPAVTQRTGGLAQRSASGPASMHPPRRQPAFSYTPIASAGESGPGSACIFIPGSPQLSQLDCHGGQRLCSKAAPATVSILQSANPVYDSITHPVAEWSTAHNGSFSKQQKRPPTRSSTETTNTTSTAHHSLKTATGLKLKHSEEERVHRKL